MFYITNRVYGCINLYYTMNDRVDILHCRYKFIKFKKRYFIVILDGCRTLSLSSNVKRARGLLFWEICVMCILLFSPLTYLRYYYTPGEFDSSKKLLIIIPLNDFTGEGMYKDQRHNQSSTQFSQRLKKKC